MATSTNYGWSEPDDSSLVRDGALAMRTLGNAIDTSVWNVGFGQAGKNKIINGDFGIWQRGTTFTNPAAAAYLADRIRYSTSTALPTSISISQQTFTPGTAPVAGYESQYFFRSVLTTVGSTTAIFFTNMVEDVRTLAGQTATFSFWAKSDSNRTQPAPTIEQQFGSGGSSAVDTTLTTFNTTTSWQRFSFTLTLPSISGKTIGTGNHLRVRILQNITNGNTLDIWGLQLEAGAKATPFQTASGGSIQGELAMCQRYYFRYTSDLGFRILGTGQCFGTTTGAIAFKYPVTMRTRPTALEQTGTASNYAVLNSTGSATACSAVPTYDAATTTEFGWVGFTVASGLTAGNATALLSNNLANVHLGWSAEL
jgi:hypothetical protein